MAFILINHNILNLNRMNLLGTAQAHFWVSLLFPFVCNFMFVLWCEQFIRIFRFVLSIVKSICIVLTIIWHECVSMRQHGFVIIFSTPHRMVWYFAHSNESIALISFALIQPIIYLPLYLHSFSPSLSKKKNHNKMRYKEY